MFRVQLNNFRCFTETPSLEVLPITFLVGENSAGKTTFLAAVRQLIEGFLRPSESPFNRDPYFLGGFDQIAHYRGGKPGRAKSFSLQILIPAATNRVATKHKFTYVKGSPQPVLSEYEFVAANFCATIDMTEDRPRISAKKDDNILLLRYESKSMPPSSLMRRDQTYLRYAFEEIAFRQDKGANVSEETQTELRNIMSMHTTSQRTLSRLTFASAPVRTQPLRTYTPSEIIASSEGSHVPLEMARQKLNSPADWGSMHERLANFGSKSGLFEEIDIRLFGRHDGDPFQVLVKTQGPKFNLVDVGYGVSQALPIIYQLEQPRPHTAFLLQQPEVHLHPRAQAEIGSTIARLSKARPASLYMVETHSDYLIDRVRMEVAKKTLDHRSVTIVFFEKREHDVMAHNIYLTEKGDLANPPENFRAFFLEEHSRLLGI
jgi:predicted ATP-dependent endonuclease of OLD family